MSLSRPLLVAAFPMFATALPLHAQESTPPQASTITAVPSRKSPWVAGMLGVVPGAGHFYAGENRRGAAAMTVFAAGVALGTYDQDFYEVCEDWLNCHSESNAADERRMKVGMVLMGASWLYSVIDAPLAARRTNRRNGLDPRPRSASLVASPSRQGSGFVDLSVSLRW